MNVCVICEHCFPDDKDRCPLCGNKMLAQFTWDEWLKYKANKEKRLSWVKEVAGENHG